MLTFHITNIDKSFTQRPVAEGTFTDPIHHIKIKFKFIIP